MKQEKGLKNTTIWFMVIVALIFDGVQVMFSWIGLGWLVIPVGYLLFTIWFWIHGLSFFTYKRWKSLAGSATGEFVTAGLLPGFAFVVAVAAFSSRIDGGGGDEKRKSA